MGLFDFIFGKRKAPAAPKAAPAPEPATHADPAKPAPTPSWAVHAKTSAERADSPPSPITPLVMDRRSQYLRNASGQAIETDWMMLRLGSYSGLFTFSPNRQWVITWSDSDPTRGVGGFRTEGNGYFGLLQVENTQLATDGNLQRPNNGSVANNGSFTIEDWGFGSELAGTFWAFNSSGKTLFHRKTSANIVGSTISQNGRYALCHTASSGTADSVKIILIDLDAGEEIYSVTPSAGWPERYEIDESNGELIAHLKGLGAFRYDRTGAFMDAELLSKAKLASPAYQDILGQAAILAKKGLIPSEAHELLFLVDKALSAGANEDEHWKAQALKIKGIAHAALGENKKAVAAFDGALRINPKIGVKRTRDMLAKKL